MIAESKACVLMSNFSSLNRYVKTYFTMNRKILTLTLMLLPLLLASCLKEKSPSEIYMDQASGVVLVLNQYYYTATLPDGSVIYFSGLDEDGDMENVAFEADEIEKSMVFGTAFFVDAPACRPSVVSVAVATRLKASRTSLRRLVIRRLTR